ncbi:hypothetical protein EW026_g2924 [Hermanssonia centrifuga]|uniref:Uncharacterized protein n=1 Tax=Hermanssonia centrifuga TaxID=98765 RepID=A0A4S4KMC3_9APHY|nr:hypothetical protein EW026_g2924 [Hermanssonia centrifuga]
MPPKPRPAYKMAAPSKDTTNAPRTLAQSMPPPPDPPPPQGLLVSEANALSTSLRSAVVRAGQIYGFYADTKRLGLNRHAPYPPRSLVSSLGRDVEKYDQLCDAMQTHLQRAITVLKRDLTRQQNRLKAAEAEAEAAARASDTPSTPSTMALAINSSATPEHSESEASTTQLQKASLPARHFTFGPPTHDVDIDLTVSDENVGVGTQASLPPGSSVRLDPALGTSADKPIELDLDIDMDMFNTDTQPDIDAARGDLNVSGPVTIKREEPIDVDFLKSLSGDTGDAEFLHSLEVSQLPQQAVGSSNPSSDILAQMSPENAMQQPNPTGLSAIPPSPGTLLANLQRATANEHSIGDIHLQPEFSFDAGFLEPQMDISGFFSDMGPKDFGGEGSKPTA